MPCVYTSPPHLRPVELCRLRLSTGEEATATFSPAADSTAVVWYLDNQFQDAAQFEDREAAIRWADDIRQMLTAPRGNA